MIPVDPVPDSSPPERDSVSKRVTMGPGFVMPDPKQEGAFVLILYDFDEDRFRVFRGAVEEPLDNVTTVDQSTTEGSMTGVAP